MEMRKFMLEEEMEKYQIENGYSLFDNEGVIDSVSVFDNAIAYLGYTPYRLEGGGKLNDTYIFLIN